MANYPDWVMKYKESGMYVTKRKNGSYSLYRGHSERVEGKKYPQLKVDEYIGTITEKDGLIRSCPAVKGEVHVYEYGLWALVDAACGSLRQVPRTYRQDAEVLFRRAFLMATGCESEIRYRQMWIHLQDGQYPALKSLDEKEMRTARRLARQIEGKLKDTLGNDALPMCDLARGVHVVHANGRHVLSTIEDAFARLLEKHGLEIRFEGGDDGQTV